jgi:drug/metabolite transporter (DMT)-like permease
MTELAVGGRSAAEYVRGALYGLAAVSIWSGWIVVARLGLKSNLTPWDIAALRFGLAGVLLLPYVVSKGFALARLGWIGLAAIVLGGGAPVLLANAGLMFAPAAHAGALFPGVMPLMVALLAAVVLHELFTVAKKIGFVLILFGVFGIAWRAGGEAMESRQTYGHLLFLGSALAWAFYTVAMRRARLDGLHAAAIAAVGALFLYMPVYLAMAGASLAGAPWGDIALQAFVQGILTAIVSLIFYGTGGRYPRRLQRCCLRRVVAGDDGRHGDPNSWRVADYGGLDCHRCDFPRRLCRERRSAATPAGLTRSFGFTPPYPQPLPLSPCFRFSL